MTLKQRKNTTLIAGAGLLVSLLAGPAGAQVVNNTNGDIGDNGAAARAGVGNAVTNHAAGIVSPQNIQDMSSDIQDSLRQAYQDYTDKKYPKAATELQAIEKKAPGLVEAHQMLAAIYQQQNQINDLVPELETIVKLSPKDQNSQTNLGVAYMQTGSFDKAAATFKTVQAQRPKDPKTAYYLGLALLQGGKTDEAVPALQNAVKLQPTAPAYLELGSALSKQGKPEDAAAAFQSAAALDPKDPQAVLYAGMLDHQAGHDDKAIPALKKALELGTDNKFGAHMTLAEAYDKAGQKDQAIQEYTLASEAKPDDFGAVANLGALEEQTGKTADATAAYRKALALSGTPPASQAQIQDALAQILAQGAGTEEAVTLLTQATQAVPTNAQYQSDLGQVYEKEGKADLALAAYQKALALEPNQPQAKAGAGRLSAKK